MARKSELAEGEKLIMMARSRWTSFILPAAVLAGYILLWHAIQAHGEDTLLVRMLLAAFGLWGVKFFAPRLVTYLMLTDKRIYGEAGILVTKTLDVPLDRVGGVYVEQTPLGRLTGRGTVTITTAGSQFQFPYIPSAVKFRDALTRQLELAQTEADRRHTQALAHAIVKAYRASERPRR